MHGVILFHRKKREREREGEKKLIVLTDYVLLLFVDGEEIKEQNCSFEAVSMVYIE
jgi:hypothetical protein